jgi:hypothetical protein
MKRVKQFHMVGLVSLVILGLMFLVSSQGPVAMSHAPAISQTGCVPAPSGLVAWWPGDGNADDIVGGNNGTLVGDTSFAMGQVAQAFSFDGSGDLVDIGNPPSLQLQDFTIDAWINRDTAAAATIAGYVSFGGYQLGICSAAICPGGSEDSLFLSKTGVDGVHSGAEFQITNLQWHHVAVTKSGSNVVFYMDGVPSTPRTYAQVFEFTATPTFRINGSTFDGLIDEVEVFNRALSASEIQAIYNAGSAGKCKNTPPVSMCQDVVVSAGSNCAANASIDNGSFDPDGDPITLSQSPLGPYLLGTTIVTLTVEDDEATDSCTAMVTVVDDTPPTVSCSVNQSVLPTLWPPNHDLVNVGLSVSAADACDANLTITVMVFGDEDDEEPTGDGTHSPDAKDIAPGTLRVRSERKGDADGRVYLIVVKATDDAGKVRVACCTVVVPKSQSQADVNAVNAQAAAARSHCLANNGAPPPGYFVIGDGPIIGPRQ